MMKRYPELFELESFFEVASTRSNTENWDWYYDSISFARKNVDETTLCIIEPANSTFRLIHTLNGQIQLDIALLNIQSLEISTSAGHEQLLGHIVNEDAEQLFKLSLKPYFSFQLGAENVS
jgi:hypothetical protein